MPGKVDSTETEALQSALAGVHAAIWGYALLTPKLGSDRDRSSARDIHDHHRDMRHRLTEMLVERKATPVSASSAYKLPFDVTGSKSARRLAAHLEAGCADVFGYLVAGAASAGLRTFAAGQLTACTRRAISWGDAPKAFPGMA